MSRALASKGFTGQVPFEMKEMRITKEGWDLIFTEPVEPNLASDPASYQISAWTYIYQRSYGSPQVDRVTPQVVRAEVSEDGLTVKLTVTGRVKGHVHELDSSALKSKDHKGLWHPKCYYTINEWPQ